MIVMDCFVSLCHDMMAKGLPASHEECPKYGFWVMEKLGSSNNFVSQMARRWTAPVRRCNVELAEKGFSGEKNNEWISRANRVSTAGARHSLSTVRRVSVGSSEITVYYERRLRHVARMARPEATRRSRSIRIWRRTRPGITCIMHGLILTYLLDLQAYRLSFFRPIKPICKIYL